jgi:hypothetical protein
MIDLLWLHFFIRYSLLVIRNIFSEYWKNMLDININMVLN